MRDARASNALFHTGDGAWRTAKSGVRRPSPDVVTPYADLRCAPRAVTGVRLPTRITRRATNTHRAPPHEPRNS